MKSATNKKSTIYMAALLLASTFFMAEEAEARGGRGGRAVGRFNGAIGQRFGGMSRRNFDDGLTGNSNSQTNNSVRWGSNRQNGRWSGSDRANQTGNQSEKRSFNANDTVREYQTTNSQIDRHIEGATERGGDYSRDKSVSYSKEDGLTKTVSTQGTTAKGAEYDHSKTVNYNKEDGYSKTATAQGTTASGGQFDRNKDVSFGQGEGYNKNVNMQGTTGNGGEYDHNKNVGYSQESGYAKEASTTGINAKGDAFEHERKTNLPE